MEEKRMTWDEIKTKYPDKWVGMSNIEWEDDTNVRSAVVVGAEDDGEEFMLRACNGEDIFTRYTNPNSLY